MCAWHAPTENTKRPEKVEAAQHTVDDATGTRVRAREKGQMHDHHQSSTKYQEKCFLFLPIPVLQFFATYCTFCTTPSSINISRQQATSNKQQASCHAGLFAPFPARRVEIQSGLFQPRGMVVGFLNVPPPSPNDPPAPLGGARKLKITR